MHDYLIRGATIVDGMQGTPHTGDVAVKDGRITAVGGRINERARERIDADGCIVTPGWVDIHTHYDGQVTWDTQLDPSASHGVTTVVMGNCGVGFAPVRKGEESELIELMEGVEDIPGSALHEGMPWGRWESYPQYLDYLDTRRYSLDVGSMLAHGAVRSYVMGERGCANEDATTEDIAEMTRLVGEGIRAGGLGFSTSRILSHMSVRGQQVPGTFAAAEELMAIAGELHEINGGLIQMIPSSTIGSATALGGERHDLLTEVELMRKLSQHSKRPLTFTLFQISEWPQLWRTVLDRTDKANTAGARLFPQVGVRPTGIVISLATYHPFMRRPSYQRLCGLPFQQKLAALRETRIREAILAEKSTPHELPGTMENLMSHIEIDFSRTFALDESMDFEPRPELSFQAKAKAAGKPPWAFLLDFLTAGNGDGFAIMYFTNYTDHVLDPVHEMQLHDSTVTGLSDAGAHVGVIFDASAPTYQLIHWTRDRSRGARLSLEHAVHRQTLKNAQLFGLDDRGALQPGRRADINVIDHAGLRLGRLEPHRDLPAGGLRLLQSAEGYVATLVNGIRTREFDKDTGERPGRLVRRRGSAQKAAAS